MSNTTSDAFTISPAPVATIDVVLTSSLAAGQSAQATARLYDANGVLLEPQAVTWSSTNTMVATVSSTGLVAANTTGSASIQATLGAIMGSASLQVTAAAATLTNATFKVVVPAATSSVDLVVDGQTHAMTGDGVVFSTTVASVPEGSTFSYSLDGGTAATAGNARQINYDYVRGTETLSGTRRSASLGAMILTRQPYAQWVEALDKAVESGFNTITIIPDWFILPDANGTTIEPVYDGDPRFPTSSTWIAPTITDTDLRNIVHEAQQRGLEVHLKPHVDPIDFGVNPSGQSRGALRPADWNAWMASYRTFIMHYAAMAQELGVPLLVIGTELDTSTMPDLANCCGGNANAEAAWRSLIADIRGAYSGTLVYSVSCFGTCEGPAKVPFWSAVDMIGIEPYFGVTDKTDPTLAEMIAGYGAKLDQYAKPLSDLYGKPIYIPEANVYSFDGANADPLNGGLVAARGVDHDEQANYYEAFFTAVSTRSYIYGYSLWAWYVEGLDGNFSRWLNDGYDPFADKIAGQVVKKWQRP